MLFDDEYYNVEDMAALLYECIHKLIEQAGKYGFYGNLWHCYLANLLVNNENSYSCGCEIRGEIEGSINKAALHDIVIFKEFYDYDFIQDITIDKLTEEFLEESIKETIKEAINNKL